MRRCGVLLHITSLPSPYGIGTFGRHAREFADFLQKAGQTYWQILPLCPTGYGDSPYQSFSTFAGNPYLIDLEQLIEDGLLTAEQCELLPWGGHKGYVDYEIMFSSRSRILHMAYDRFKNSIPQDYYSFIEKEADWLDDYALFMSIKAAYDGASWDMWDDDLRMRRAEALDKAREQYADDIAYQKFVQYEFYKQWTALKQYVNERGIEIIGDLPIYVSADSADVWSAPQLFMLDEQYKPIEVAGCPPDAFTDAGQLWGNPLYDWDKMEQDDYSWWVRRIRQCRRLYDVTRIDHFRGFESYYAIPYGMPDAKVGQWRKGPGLKLFRSIEKQLGKQNIIAEDLGFLTPSVKRMLRASGYPGMKVIQFGFDPNGDSEYLPHNYEKKCVVYTGTHDNETIIGWGKHSPKADVRYAKRYLGVTRSNPINWAMMTAAVVSVADTAILMMQDLLDLGSEARMNTPSTLGDNWKWRAPEGVFTDYLANRLYTLCDTYRRVPQKPTAAADSSDSRKDRDKKNKKKQK